jgi:predicted N-formylglutamate amidohydrolase
MSRPHLLSEDDGPTHEVINEGGRSSAVLLVDHASFAIPRRLGDLGLSEADRRAHIAGDIGAADVAKRLSAILDAPLVLSGFSRLVIDCNRPLGVPSSIPAVTCGVTVPGNANVSESEARDRAAACYEPYHAAVRALLDVRKARNERTVVLAIHSFTPVMQGFVRPWHAGVLYHLDVEYGALWLQELRRDERLVVGDNEPYRVSDESDSSIPVHAERRGLHGVLIELRQDLVGDPSGAAAWAQRLAVAHRAVDARLALAPTAS